MFDISFLVMIMFGAMITSAYIGYWIGRDHDDEDK